jgi:hypothetical protein
MVWDPGGQKGTGSRIPDLDPGSESRIWIPNPDPQHGLVGLQAESTALIRK